MAEGRQAFEIGLVLAGTVSAGAYTAGVIDFLLEALAAWEAAKASGEPLPDKRIVPDHSVQLRSLSGASGGAITAALLARCLASEITPVRDGCPPPDPPIDDPTRQPAPFENPLYATWVQSIDIRHLLGTADLKSRDAKVVSLLDSSVLPHIGKNALNVAPGRRRDRLPKFVGDTLDIFFTTTNLRGVPYGITFQGQLRGYSHMMTAFADYSRFALCSAALQGYLGDALRLPFASVGPAGAWQTLLDTSLASSAFPVGLAPRLLSRPARVYDKRTWPIPQALPLRRADWRKISDGTVPEHDLAAQRQVVSTAGVCLVAVPELQQPIPPTWPPGIDEPTYEYRYWNVDGGLMNNQPLELARRVLTRGAGRNPRAGDEATRAIVMVEPFPTKSDMSRDYDENISLVAVVTRMFTALEEQARFKAEDLELAKDETVYSRFVIAPDSGDDPGRAVGPTIMADLLGGFGAFLCESFRRHDFLLGRRNCQQFLRDSFALPERNKNVFGTAAPWMDGWYLKKPDGTEQRDGDGQRYLPIIPLMPGVAAEIPLPQRPRPSDVDEAALAKAITARLEAVVPRLIDEVPVWIARLGLDAVWHGLWLLGQRHRLSDMIMAKIKDELDRLS